MNPFMSIFNNPSQYFSQENDRLFMQDMPDPALATPSSGNRIDLVAQPTINQFVHSTLNDHPDGLNRPDPVSNGTLRRRFTHEEDQIIFAGKVAKKTGKEIVKMLPGRSAFNILNRWKYLEKLDPDLNEKVEKARAEQGPIQLIQPENGNPEVLNRQELLTPRTRRHKFTHEEDLVIFAGKVARKTDKEIAKMLPERKLTQILNRWEYLERLHPDLQEKVERVRAEQARFQPIPCEIAYSPLKFDTELFFTSDPALLSTENSHFDG